MGKYISRGRTIGGRTSYRPGPGLGPASRAAVALGIKAYRAYTATRRSRSSPQQIASSYQNDSRTIYRKKRMPRRRRRRWVRALRRNVALQMPQQPTRTWVFNQNFSQQFTGTGMSTDQQWWYSGLHTWNGSAGHRDMRRIAIQWPEGDLSTTNRKFLVSSAVADITGNYVSTNPALSLEVDLYVIDAGRKITTAFGEFGTEFIDIESDLSGNMILSSRGATPFQFPPFGGLGHRLKVLYKRRWQLSPGQAITYQYRDPRNRYISTDELESNSVPDNHYSSSYRTSGTKVFLFIGKIIGDKQAEDIVAFNTGITRTYTTKALPATMQEGSAIVGSV